MPLDWREIFESALMQVANVLRRRSINRRRQATMEVRDAGGKTIGTLAPVRAKPSFPFLFRVVPVSTLELLAMDSRLIELDRRLLMLLIVELAGKGWLPLKQEVLASRLGVTQSTVSRSMTRLSQITANGVPLIERQSRGNSVTGAAAWRLNESVAWMGTAVNWHIVHRTRGADRAGRDSVDPETGEVAG